MTFSRPQLPFFPFFSVKVGNEKSHSCYMACTLFSLRVESKLGWLYCTAQETCRKPHRKKLNKTASLKPQPQEQIALMIFHLPTPPFLHYGATNHNHLFTQGHDNAQMFFFVNTKCKHATKPILSGTL